MSKMSMMETLFRLLTEIENMDNYDERKIAVDNVDGYCISTMDTEHGPETAIAGADHLFHTVERYSCKESARAGHNDWVHFVRGEKAVKVTDIGYGAIESSEHMLFPEVEVKL